MLVIEDGGGVVGANSYVSVQEASDYIEAFIPEQFTSWDSKSELQQEAILINAAKYLDSMLRWQSTLIVGNQGLEWPRLPFIDLGGRTVEGVPSLIKESQMRLAAESITKALYSPEAKLVIDTYGNSSQTYTKDGVIDGTGVIQDVKRILTNYGYGRSGTSIVEFHRV